ncbi:hypothetical protein [Celeribacter sp.]
MPEAFTILLLLLLGGTAMFTGSDDLDDDGPSGGDGDPDVESL